jgi:hypothetical protein
MGKLMFLDPTKASRKEDICMLSGDLPHPTTGAPIPALLTWLQKN